MICSACSFEMYLMPPAATYWFCWSIFPTAFFCSVVASGLKYTFTTSCFLTWFDHETVHEPSAMKSPSRNMPIRTVIVAATVVERFAPSARHASLTRGLRPPLSVAPAPSSLSSFVPAAALVTGEPAVFELDDPLAHLVHHLAVVRHHQ